VNQFLTKMTVIGQKCPCTTVNFGLGNQFHQPRYKILPVIIRSKNFPAFDPSDDHMLMITWYSAPGASILAFLGIIASYPSFIKCKA
jgi:hypothetical protein